MSRGLPAPILVAALALACGEDASGPAAALCATRHGAEVCVDRPEYRPTQSVTITTRNVSGGPIFKDACATRLVGVTNLEVDFDETYDPRLRCGAGATRAEIMANMVELGPGASFEEALTIHSFAFQGYYRANVWILDAEGGLVAEAPATSGVFEVFPSAKP
ncbi:hypothetical protein [Candidatus Palauibacter sp.]|uniref:hypothetical protein n=1 Tax=Candidatus Palauibacter sp. TaxID=3101350 RepID=UPI003B58BD07